MSAAPQSPEDRWTDLFNALEFVEKRFAQWTEQGVISPALLNRLQEQWNAQRENWDKRRKANLPDPGDTGLREGRAGESATAHSLRYWEFVMKVVSGLAFEDLLPLAQYDILQTEILERQAALAARLAPEDLAHVVVVEATSAVATPVSAVKLPSGTSPRSPSKVRGEAPKPRRTKLEILLDPRNSQWLLAFGGTLMVTGLIIFLYINDFFTPRTTASILGIANLGVLLAGWWLMSRAHYLHTGRALTLLACFVMPLNLWYYQANQLLVLDGHLWMAAMVISVLYAISAWVLRDELFVYVFMFGVTLTGLLILASLEPSPQKLLEVASPATLLVVVGILGIHLERLFPAGEGPFTRQRFGMAFFWSGHATLAAGLLLVLGAQVAGDWLYEPLYRSTFERWELMPSPIVGELRWLAILLVVAGTYAYIYSDLVVRHVGIYVHIAAGMLLWLTILIIEQLKLPIGIDTIIAALALVSLIINLAQIRLLQNSPYTRAFPILGVLLPLLAVILGVVVYFRAISIDIKSVWQVQPPSWSYLIAMVLTAVSCRVGAYLYRTTSPQLTTTYFFATGAATLTAAVALLASLGLTSWQSHAPIVMLIPIVYLLAAHLYRGHSPERPLLWVSHTATAIMLVSSIGSSIDGFRTIVEDPSLNLSLAIFFVEAALFYGLAAVLFQHVAAIHLSSALLCGAIWQLLTYAGIDGEYYILAFGVVGVLLLLAYRFAVLERFGSQRLPAASFQSGITLVGLSFGLSVLLALNRLSTHQVRWAFVGMALTLTLVQLIALVLVRHTPWRRWSVLTMVGQALVAFLALTNVSTLSPGQKVEVFCVSTGILLLVLGHIGWYREEERHNDLVSFALFLGSVLAGCPLAIATLVDRSRNDFIFLNEAGFLATAVVLLTSGYLLQLKSTTLVGAFLTVLYFMTLLIYVPWNRLSWISIALMVGGGILFTLGLLLSVFRDRLVLLPERIKQRQGVFRVLAWR